jgi:hypothetical protein
VIAVGTVHGWLLNHPGKLEKITFVLFDDEALAAYTAAHAKRKRQGPDGTGMGGACEPPERT